MAMTKRRWHPRRPTELLEIEDADELPDGSGVDDRSTFNLGDGTRWIEPHYEEDVQ
jgi:hypothetical protein